MSRFARIEKLFSGSIIDNRQCHNFAPSIRPETVSMSDMEIYRTAGSRSSFKTTIYNWYWRKLADLSILTVGNSQWLGNAFKAMNQNKKLRSAARCLFGIMALAGVTTICFLLNLNVSTVGFFYLIIIVLLSLSGDLVSSIIDSIVAAGCLAYFFAPPIFTIRVHESLDAIAIVAFSTTSLLISHLVSEVRTKSDEALSSVNRKLLDAVERESRRIARELHDDVGQRLAMLAVQLEQIEGDLPVSASEVGSRLTVLRGQTSELSSDVHALSHQLHSSKLEYLGIAKAMRGFCREFAKQHEVTVDFSGEGLAADVPPEVSLCLFRVLQEALQNAAKHSGVRSFEVELFGTSEVIRLAVHDSGAGFNSNQATSSKGLGVTSMQERMKLVNGNLSIDSKPREGTTIHAWVPLPHGDVQAHSQRKQRSIARFLSS